MTVAFDLHSEALIAPQRTFDPPPTVQHLPLHYAEQDAEHVYEPYAPFVWSDAARSDSNAYGRFGLRHATECMRGTVEPLMHGPTRRAAHKSTRASSAMAKAAKMRSMENAKQAVCWALQARGVTPSQIEAEAEHVLEAAVENCEEDVDRELEVDGKFQQGALLRRVLSSHQNNPESGRGSRLERTVTDLGNKSRGLRARAARCPSAPPVRRPAPKSASKPKQMELPFEQVRSLFRERMRSVMLQDGNSMRKLFASFGGTHNGTTTMTSSQLRKLTDHLGMELTEEQSEQLVFKMSETTGTRLTFQDFLENLLALPHDFFQMNFTSESFQKVQEPLKLRQPLPAGTSVEYAHNQLTKSLRRKLLDIGRLRHACFKAMPGKMHLDKTMLWDTFGRLKMTCKVADFEEIFDYFNFRRNSKLNQVEFLCELLELPYPDGFAPPPPKLLQNRKKLRPGTLQTMLRLKHKIEKLGCAGKTPTEHVRRMWKGYDIDGSGEIAYDEIYKMTREFDIGVEGENSAADILAYLDPSGKGFLTYKDFLDGLVVLDPEVFAKEQPDYILGGRDGLSKVEDERPSTPELRAEIASKIKQKMISSTAAVKRAFSLIHKNPDEGCSLREFNDAFAKLGFPVKPEQVKQLFEECGPDSQGLLSIDKFYTKIIGTPMHAMDALVQEPEPEGVTKDPVATSRPATAASSRSRRNWGRPATAYQPPSTREPPWGLDLDQLIHSSNAPTQRQEKKVMGHVVHRPGTAMARRPQSEPAVPRTVYAVPHPMERTAKKRPGTVVGKRDAAKTTKLTASWAAQTPSRTQRRFSASAALC